MTTPEPTIPERLRRLHRLYLAMPNAVAVNDLADPRWLIGRLERHINDELAAIEADAAGRGCSPEDIIRIRGALVDQLRPATRYQVRAHIAQTAFREAEKSGAILPKTMLSGTRTWLRQAATRSEHEAQQAIRTVLDIMQLTEGAA